jgi:hypothetical protein
MGKEAMMEGFLNGQPFGSMAAKLLAANMDPRALRTNDVLLHEEWKLIDDKVVAVARKRLVAAADLINQGLFLDIPNGLGVTVLGTQTSSDMSAADLNMDAIAPGAKDRPKFDIAYLPLPIAFKDFDISARVLGASRRGQMALDTRTAAIASKIVAEKIDSVIFNGASTYAFGGGTLYGYVDYPDAAAVTLDTEWDASGMTGALILADVLDLKQALIDMKKFGPYMVYVPTNYDHVLDADYSSNYPNVTVRTRIKMLDNVLDCKVGDSLPDDTVIMVDMTEDSVRLVIGMQPTTMQDESNFGLLAKFKVAAIMVPQIFSDADGNCGVAILS